MLIPHGTIVMAADGGNMKLFRNIGTGDALKLELVTQSAQSSPRTSAMGTDTPGRSVQGATVGRSSAYDATDYHQEDEDAFAIDAAGYFNTLLTKDARGILIAAPRTLGMMRKHLSGDARGRLLAEIDKDFAQRSVVDIATMLENYEG